MSDGHLAPPVWARRRDGRLVPFDADEICRALFAAGEALGRPDAFLARELTDGAVHFLAHDGDAVPTTEQIADVVARAVRELGHPALAAAFAARRGRRDRAAPELVCRFPTDADLAAVRAGCARQFARQAVFARDLIAAADAGLLALAGLDEPAALAGHVLNGLAPASGQGGLLEALAEARAVTAGTVALDGPEHLLTRAERPDVAALVRELTAGLRLTGLRAVVNLNCAVAPSAAGDVAGGPLFAAQHLPPERRAALADELADALADTPGARIDWHLAEADLAAEGRPQLLRLARRALEGTALAFVFDRPRRPVALAEGLDRTHRSALLWVGVALPRLAEQPGLDGPEALLTRLGSLARLALSAGAQKRAFLRRHGGAILTDGFLLDRARLVVTPLGLDDVVRRFTGHGLTDGGAALDLGRKLIQRLGEVLRQDGPARISAGVDWPDDTGPVGDAPLRAQARVAAALHGAADGGTLTLTAEEATTPEHVVEWLALLGKTGDVCRVRLGRARPRQLTLTP
jgi:hypothetical protein